MQNENVYPSAESHNMDGAAFGQIFTPTELTSLTALRTSEGDTAADQAGINQLKEFNVLLAVEDLSEKRDSRTFLGTMALLGAAVEESMAVQLYVGASYDPSWMNGDRTVAVVMMALGGLAAVGGVVSLVRGYLAGRRATSLKRGCE